ncbi:GNAT family N-acetyltransferase [Bacillus sp. FJAT-49732]|uniref:GNAT family N-acetyltransferase n=1 Tax=Lederbergia citrisecunda TaxID=2833583 RepID=A0A942TMD0_9BACI|nr:GNAT family N-acetyltransferase [Lederbergia citrisecunda]MBS4198539.1 GNAT family N-acetyltransferase [Lederbergia citrisecunda]
MFLIRELESTEDIVSAFQVMKHLRTHLDEESYIAIVRQAQEKENYRLAAYYDHNGKIVAVVGFMPMITLYYGHYIWVCDLVTSPKERSKGYGEQLLSYVHDWAKANGYEKVALSSGLQREDAHRFYEEKMKYDKVSYVFLKNV